MTSNIISSFSSFSAQSIKRQVIDQDFTFQLNLAASDPSLRHVHAVAVSSESSWPKVWDVAMDRGPSGTSSALAMLKLLSLRPVSNNLCPVPNCKISVSDDSLSNHFIVSHTNLSISVEDCVYSLINCTDNIFSYGHVLHTVFKSLWSY